MNNKPLPVTQHIRCGLTLLSFGRLPLFDCNVVYAENVIGNGGLKKKYKKVSYNE